YGPRVVGVVLSGTLDDGTAGLAAVKRRGGLALVQCPDEALYAGMPQSAIENAPVDEVLPVAEIAAALGRLAREPVQEEGGPVSDEMEREADIAELDLAALQNEHRPGTPAGFGCPDCGGALWDLRDGNLVRFRCRVGHAWTAESLLAEQTGELEKALWTALRALEERAALSRRVAERLSRRGSTGSAVRFDEQARDSEQHAAL